jgi:hypothetical protein
MIWCARYERMDYEKGARAVKKSFLQTEDPICSKCQSPLVERPAHPYPVLLQALFAVSFVAFLICFDSIRAHSIAVWIWSAVQILLAIALTRARIRARRKTWQCVYSCIPSDSALR